MPQGSGQDHWAAWLAERRHGGDPEQHRRVLELLAPIRDRVIANAALAPGSALLDVGCGDGLIALAAAEVVGTDGYVVFSDVSADLLQRCRELAGEAGFLDRSSFVQASARDLSAVADDSVDAVTLRSVLIYESDKAEAFAEFYRVLRPGGRLSLFEPINRYGTPEPPGRFGGYDVEPVAELIASVRAVYQAIQPADEDRMMNFDERDLVALAEGAGFDDIHLRLHVDVSSPEPRVWQTMLNASGNPRTPTLAEAMAQVLTPNEMEEVTAHLQPLVEQGRGLQHDAVAYLWAAR